MSFVFKKLPTSAAAAIAQQIDTHGYAVVEDFVAPEDLSVAQQFVCDAVAASGGDYAGFNGTKDLGGTFLASLPNSPSFNGLCHGIYEKALGQPAPDTGYYQILRCLSGPGVKKHSMRFHFDSYILTALIPIMIPDHGALGRLIIHPNTRPLRRSYLANLADKVLVDNPLTQALLNAAYQRGSKRVVRLTLKPGSLYFFWGYRSLHTNEPCDADAIRATALLHYVDPHADSRFKQVLRRH